MKDFIKSGKSCIYIYTALILLQLSFVFFFKFKNNTHLLVWTTGCLKGPSESSEIDKNMLIRKSKPNHPLDDIQIYIFFIFIPNIHVFFFFFHFVKTTSHAILFKQLVIPATINPNHRYLSSFESTKRVVNTEPYVPFLMYIFNTSRADTWMVQWLIMGPFSSANPAYID